MPDLFHPHNLQLWLHALGLWAWPVFIGLQVLQVVVFWIPGEVVQIAGGMVFGVVEGTVLSLAGISLGSLIAFLLSRKLGKSWVDRWLAGGEHKKMEKLVHHPRLDVILFTVFFIPWLPKDVFCYLAGLSGIKTWRFFWVTTLARIPSLVLSSWMGDLAVHGFGLVMVIVLSLCAVLAVGLFFYRNALMAFLVKD